VATLHSRTIAARFRISTNPIGFANFRPEWSGKFPTRLLVFGVPIGLR
jgi:hypothetical protein